MAEFPSIRPEHNIQIWNGILDPNRSVRLIKAQRGEQFYYYWTNAGWESYFPFGVVDNRTEYGRNIKDYYYLVEAPGRERQTFPTLELAWQYINTIGTR